jgi:hypothetical protein
MAVQFLLGILGYLLVKHFIADFCLQASYQVRHKGTYGHAGGLLHAGIHAVLTVPMLYVVLGDAIGIITAIMAAEFVLHYHIDYLKEVVTRRSRVGPDGHLYWVYLGFDQLAHQACYLALAAYLVTGPAKALG